jgi:outer membrane protein
MGQICRLWPGVILLVSICSAPMSMSASENQLLTLDQAIDFALKQNRQVQINMLDLSKTAEQTNQVKTQRLPVFQVYANAGASLRPIDLTIPPGILGVYSATGPIPAQESRIRTPRRVTGLLYGSAAQPLLQLYKVHLYSRAYLKGHAVLTNSGMVAD